MGSSQPELNINFHGRQFSGSTVGIVGMGRIGMAVAKRAAAFDCKILYHNRSQRSDEGSVGATYYKGIDSNTQNFVLLYKNITIYSMPVYRIPYKL